MRLNVFKSKIVTGAMALMLTVSMMPGMAFAEDVVSDEAAPEITAQENESVAEVRDTTVDADTTQVRSNNNLSVVDPANVASIVISGANVVSCTVSTVNSNNGNSENKTHTYNIVLQQGTPQNAEVTASFTKAPNSQCTISKIPRISGQPYPTIPAVLANQSLVYPINLSAGEGTANAYLFPNLTGTYNGFTRFDTYKFVYTTAQTQSVDISFGDPQFPPTPPESYMVAVLEDQNVPNNYYAKYNGTIANYYPDMLTVRIEGSTTLRTEDNGVENVCFVEYDANGVPEELAVPTNQNASIHTIKIKNEGRIVINENIYLKFLTPQAGSQSGAGFPTMFKGYLPMGQFATGSGWGSPYTDGNTQQGTTAKIVSGFAGTGISLGAAGGYAEYDMAVDNSNKNKYGIDFIVYGNAFNRNPEAGSVKVYGKPSGSNTAGWYELAGSRYYQDETLRNVNVSYKNDGGTLKYRVTKGDIANPSQVLKNWTPFGGNVGWLPTAEKYNRVKGNVDDVIANLEAGEVTYGGVTLVRDTDTNADYAFGYFDVADNGEENNIPVNPYLSSNVGANGFDISWAVDDSGNPVDLQEISKIRVYTSSALNINSPDPNDFTVPSIFGETSAELTGIVRAGEQQSVPVGVTEADIFIDSYSLDNIDGVVSQQISDTVSLYTMPRDLVPTSPQGVFDVNILANTGDNVYINDEMVTSKSFILNDVVGKMIRVIVQNSTKEPSIVIIEVQP